MIDVEADDVTVRIEVYHESLDDFTRLRARRVVQFDIEAVGLRVIVQLHGSSSRKLRSKNALWTVSPSSSVTTRRNRGRVRSACGMRPQKRIRPSLCTSRRIGDISACWHHS